MSGETDSLKISLQAFGLEPEEADVYIEILKNNSITALQLSKNLKIARTKIYRLLDKLIDKAFVSENVDGYGKKFTAVSPDKLNQILKSKEQEVIQMKNSVDSIINSLTEIQNQDKNISKILHYKGSEGLKQVSWNSTKAEGVLRIFELATNMDEFMPADFNEKIRYELAKNNVEVRQLTNYKELDQHTNVTELIKIWEPRYIDPKEFKIHFEILIYNNAYTMYNFRDEELFCVEIHNPALAEMQKQIFDSFWDKAIPMKKIGEKGKAILDVN